MDMRAIIDLMEAADQPHVDADVRGTLATIHMFYVPPHMRGRGEGRRVYEEWEASLPKTVSLVRLMAADYGDGAGLSNGFWEAMGYSHQYDGEDLDYETSQWMWKGVNGHPTPPTVRVEDD